MTDTSTREETSESPKRTPRIVFTSRRGSPFEAFPRELATATPFPG
ncbi:hypothetical protein MUK42_14139 [Musa troglodytarum]|uniref:Uncharacterized protein n=1 Tax=Musa troglodytarum TaxID=320322 RepID=A0A9E7IKD3_9LILI|nr:hypothetical protein MUK42_14139 [Musa troglodytarum]